MATKKSLYWKIPMSVFINQTERTTKKMSSGETCQIQNILETLQQVEEYLFDNFMSFDDSMEADDDEIKQATEYIKSQVKKELSKQSKITLDDYAYDIRQAVIRAKTDAYDSSYQQKYIERYWKLVFDKIWKTCAELYGNRPYLYNDRSKNMDKKPFTFGDVPEGEIWDADEVWIEVPTERAKEELKNNFDEEQLKQTDRYQEYMDEHIAYGNLENSYYQLTYNDRENIDRYTSFGDTDGWLDNFKDQEEISQQIKNDIKAEYDKINDKQFLHDEISKGTTQIRMALMEYSTDKEYNSQILRQVGSIEATIKHPIYAHLLPRK